MSERIKKFLAKPKKVLLKGEEIEIYPLKLKDIDLLIDMQDESKQGESLKKIIFETLKLSFPEATDEEINAFSIEFFEEITNAILEVNGLDLKKKEQIVEDATTLKE